jgi:HAD superfamily hydrolase (TIGR01484 family)
MIVVAAQAQMPGVSMNLPLKIISTDFDGTFFAEFANPPVPDELQRLIQRLQTAGARWVINTGRDLSSLLETLARAHLCVRPDYLVVVEREIYVHERNRYVGLEDWNRACAQAHEELFARVRTDLPRLMAWVNERFDAAVYEDSYSPFCLIAENNSDADIIHDYLNDYCARVPSLTVVRNDVYARFSHAAYSKGTALSEIARRLSVGPDLILAAGDHLNDLPMLSREHARWLVAPSNAIALVKDAVRKQDGFVSDEPHGHGVARGVQFFLESAGVAETSLNSKT